MKIFTNKKIGKKILIAIVIVLLFQIFLTSPIQAKNEKTDTIEFGGKLMGPILSLLVTIGDGIMDIIGKTIMGASSSIYEIQMGSEFWEIVGTALAFIAGAAIAIALIFVTGGIAGVIGSILGISVKTAVGIGTIVTILGSGTYSAIRFNKSQMPENVYLPMYTYSAEEIFKGNILLFDVNFFQEGREIFAKLNDGEVLSLKTYDTSQKLQEEIAKKTTKLKTKDVKGTTSKAEDVSGEVEVPREVEYYYYVKDGQEIKTSNQNSAVMLRKTISSWYNALRNICIVLMLSVLVYIGIRMLLSSVASDKAKYLTMLKDWFVGLCLLFLMHYIMAFSVTIVERLTDVVKTSVDGDAYAVTIPAEEKIEKAVTEDLKQGDLIQEANGEKYLTWPTNLMGSLRLQLQMQHYGAQYIGLSICFLILCLFTLYFTITYMKRVLHMAFLTLIAPMVALTYCIDKLNDGQAQGFNKWMKEYIFNLLIQPMHLLLYYILITSAFEFASTNVIYSIVAIGFMIPAEKLLRSLFGFEKAQTAPAMGPAGAMMASTALNHLLNRGKGKGKNDANGKGGDDIEEEKAPNPRETGNPMAAFLNRGEEPPEGSIRTEEPPAIEPPQRPEVPTGGIVLPNSVRMAQQQEAARQARLEQERAEQEALRRAQEQQQQRPQSKLQRLRQRAASGVRNYIGSTPTGQRFLRNFDANLAAQKAVIRMIPQKFKEKIENSHPLKAAGKIAAGATLGAAVGAVGVGIAASTGEDGNLAKIGGGAAATAFAVGSGRAQNIESPMEDETVKAVYDNTRNKGEYKQAAQQDFIDRYKKNEKHRNYLERKFGTAEAKQMIEGGEIEEYLNNDITDIKDIAAMHKLQTDGVVRNREEAITIAQIGQMVGSNTNQMTEKTRKEWKERFKTMAGQSGVSEANQDSFAEQRLKELDKFHDYKK